PGSLIVLLLAVICYSLASWVMAPHTRYLVVVGIATGGLLMSKINVGLFAVAAIVVAFVIGNRRYPRWFRAAVGAGAVLLPIVIASERIYQGLTAGLGVPLAFF